MYKKLRNLSLGIVVLGLALWSSTGWGQTFYGSIAGTVLDASGAAVPGATVTLTNIGTAEKRTMESDPAGLYRFVNLVPARYRLEAEKSGFKHFTREPIVVEVQNALAVDIPMEVGALTQTVEVTGRTPLLQPQTSSLGQVVESRKVTEMPLSGRNPLALVALVPGVVPQGNRENSALGNPTGTNIFAWGNFQIGGGQSNQSVTYIDGGPVHTSYLNLLALVPTQDAIQEFKVETSNLGPEWGRFAGGVINLTTKSGRNEFHGSAYEFLRNKVLNANDWSNNKAGIGRPPFTQNQFGGNLGGRILRDKLFFFSSYEGYRQRRGQSFLYTVPTDLMRQGNFTDLRDSSGNVIPIYDPCGGDANWDPVTRLCKSVPATRTQFQSGGVLNVIPPERLDPTAKILTNYWAPANLAGTQYTHTQNYATNASAGGNNTQINERVDYNLSDKQRIFGRYTYWTNLSLALDPYKTGICVDRCEETFHTHQFVLSDVYTFSPTTILDVHVSWLRFIYDRAPKSLGVDLTTFGWPAFLNSQVGWRHIPQVNVTNYQDAWGTSGTGSGIFARDDTWSVNPSLTKIQGRHTLKMGGEIRRLTNNYAQSNSPSGAFNFNNVITAVDPITPGATGNPFASFLLGYGTGGSATTPGFMAEQIIYRGLYFGDTFQVTNKLTLNLGLRYDLQGPWSERFDRMILLLPNADNQLSGQTPLGALQGRLGLVNSPDRASRNPMDMSKKQFNPRFGFAYRLNDKTVLRGGYGIFWLPLDVKWNDAPHNMVINTFNTQWTATIDAGRTPYTVLSNPFPGGIIQPGYRDPAFQNTLLGQGISGPVANNPWGYAQQWNLNIQRELPDGTLIDVAYAGSKGVHLPAHGQQIDQMPTNYLSLGAALENQVCNPFYRPCTSETDTTSAPYSPALITSGSLSAPTVARGQLLRPFPQYTGIGISEIDNRNSIYHSLQAKVEKRLRGGGSILAAYTVSKLITDTDTLTGWLEAAGSPEWGDTNSYDIRAERTVAPFDVSQRFVLSYVLDLPFGRGHRWGKDVNPVASKLISGWGINGITTLQAGFPLFLGGPDQSHSFGGGGARPDNNGQSAKKSGSAQSRLGEWFDTSVFTPATPFTFGNVSRTLPDVRTPGINNFDFAIFKNTTFGPGERMGVQFRAEFFNLFNRTQFGYPDQGCCRTAQGGSNDNFGVISSQANFPRLVQFALRFTF